MGRTAVLAATSALFFGLATGPVARQGEGPLPGGPGRAALPVPPERRPVALVDGRRLTWGEIRPHLAELAGVTALEEVILEERLRAAIEDGGIVITPDDTARELDLLVENLDPDPNVAARLLDRLRTRQRLGPVRFQSLLFRNAALRALVAKDTTVTEAAVAQEYELRYGARRQPRIILLPTLADANDVLDALAAGAEFSRLAAERSTDISATRGGLLPPITRNDRTYPEALRAALFQLEPGGTSGVVLVDRQHAILFLEREIPAEPVDPESIRDELIRYARLRNERVAMDGLARSLIADLEMVIFDESLDDAWRRRR